MDDQAATLADAAAGPVVTAGEPYSAQLGFTLNGQPVTLQNPDPGVLLVDFLRSPEVGLTGTKLVCGEGGCGACTVLVTRVDPYTGKVAERAINSCLHPLCSLDGADVTTVEGTGSTATGMSEIQQRVVGYNGTQCGFCTPGWVMNMEGLLRSGVPLTPQVVEDHFDGNLCRCTGMRPILDAMQSFVTDPPRNQPTPPPPPPAPQPLHFSGSGYEWYRLLTLDDVRDVLLAGKATSKTTKLVNGNTSIAIYKRDVEDPHLLVDVSLVPELREVDPTNVSCGAGLSLAELAEFLEGVIVSQPTSATAGLRELLDRVLRIANVQVRNVGTIGGNLMITRENADSGSPFPSDLYTALATLGATVSIAPSDRSLPPQVVPVLELPSFDAMPGGFVLTTLTVPLTQPNEYVKTYKVARRVQNAHALVNAGFRVRFDSNGNVAAASIVLGGIAAMPLAVDTPSLVGQPWNWQTWSLLEKLVATAVAANLVPMPEAGVSDAYRASLAQGLTYKFFVWLALQVAPAIVPATDASAGEDYERPVSFGTTRLTSYPDEWPVGEPILTLSADIQATGEAVYTQDLATAATTLQAAYVYGQQLHADFGYTPLGGLSALVAEVRRLFPGVQDFVTVADIPAAGKNMQGWGGDDPVFADGTITAYGQPIGLVLADRLRTAQDAAAWIQANGIAYTPLEPTVTTIEEALALPDGEGLFQDHPPFPVHIDKIVRPGSDTAWLDANPPPPEPGKGYATGTVQTGAQAHFYFETQTILAVPGERDQLALYCSSQDLASCQQAAAKALGLEAAKISAHVIRVGGGFGGKETRPPLLAAAVAVAAAKCRRSVRLVLDRNTDMAMIGTRHPFMGRYWVSYGDDGTIEKWRTDFFANGGDTYDVTFPVSDLVVLSADGNYMVDTWGVNATCCRTNRMTSTAMRSFGVIQCSLIIEDAIEQVAYNLDLLPEYVRWMNFYADSDQNAKQSTPYGQELKYAIGRAIWKRLGDSCDFSDRLTAVRQFNAANRWRKRGISMIPIKYGISYTYLTGNQGGALLTVCDSDGTVVLATGGVEMGQGLATKLVQIAAEQLGIDMSMIQPAQTATEVVPNASSTGASTGTDLNGGAVKLASADLKARLVQWCEDHEHDPNYQPFPDWRNDWSRSWPEIVAYAYDDRQDLSAQALYASPDLSEFPSPSTNTTPFYYFTWSAACSEVEIDVLTGEFTILRSDILYDAGKSLNADLDAGQIWGGFVQGIGNVTTEQMYYADNGRPISDGTWNYKPPCSKTIPVDFRVTLLDYEKQDPVTHLPLDPYGIQSSKSTGEPPLVLANTVFFAIKHAVLAARADAGVDGWFEFDAPATVEQIQLACSARPGPDA